PRWSRRAGNPDPGGRVRTLAVNGRTYRLPTRPVVVVCVDGGDPRYLERGLAHGILPPVAPFRETGFSRPARAAPPPLPHPHNVPIVTGVPPAVHGVSGNYFHERETGRDVMMDDPRFLRCPTIPAALSEAGVRTAVVTAKDKLRRLLGHGLRGICFSAERAG